MNASVLFNEEWAKKRQELEDALLHAANELATFSNAAEMRIDKHGLRIYISVLPNRFKTHEVEQ